jgi:hypothetical protein
MKNIVHKLPETMVWKFVFCVLVFTSFSCIESPTAFVGPTFDTQISIPVIDTTKYFIDFARSNSVFILNHADSTYSTIFSTLPIPIDTLTNQPARVALGEIGVKGLSATLKNISAIDGTMNFEFTNRIPIALSFQVHFLKWDSAATHSDTLFRISPDSLIQAPAVDINGFAINPRISNIAVIFTGEQIDLMPQADSIFIKLYFNVGNELKSVKFKKDDYIRNRTSFHARYTINKPERENGK